MLDPPDADALLPCKRPLPRAASEGRRQLSGRQLRHGRGRSNHHAGRRSTPADGGLDDAVAEAAAVARRGEHWEEPVKHRPDDAVWARCPVLATAFL